jgi:hypothetical protein
MLIIQPLGINSLYTTTTEIDIETEQYKKYAVRDCVWDKAYKVLSGTREWTTQTGGVRLMVPMTRTDALEIDDSDTTGSETKVILIAKAPEGFFIGVYLY